MDVFEAVRTIVAVRSYRDQPVPEDVVRKIVEAGHLSASSVNLQPWHFVVVESRETLRQLGSILRTGPYTAQAALAIVAAVEKESTYGVSDVSRAVQNMMLTAWDEGVGSNWVGFGGMTEVAPVVGIPDTYDVLAVLPFGYPEKPARQGKKKRKPLAEIASREQFGQPFT
jgi:nitroreductase